MMLEKPALHRLMIDVVRVYEGDQRVYVEQRRQA